jgi:hypothetical protein
MAFSELKSDAAKEKKPTAANAVSTGESTANSAASEASNSELPATTIPERENASVNPFLALGALLVLTLSLPILMAFGGGVISLLIVGFGVWEAWRINKRIALQISGPHPIAAEAPPLAGAAASV